ncbi:MAG: NADH-quinone oxidoreductase subunit NuoN, partial [Hyphomicrobiales bacterium]
MNMLIYMPLLPEILLSIMSMVLLMIGVFSKNENAYSMVSNLAIATLVLITAIILSGSISDGIALGNSLIVDSFSQYLKILILVSTIIILIVSNIYLKDIKVLKFEYIILILISVIGMMMMVSSNDLVTLYLSIELQSLPLYVLASIRNKSLKSTESGLKYFVLGALSSCILLYGLSLIYGYAGSIYYSDIASTLVDYEIGILIGLAFALAGFAFKISAVPFHMWTPDVYEGSPTTITAFFAVAPKIAALGLITRILFTALPTLIEDWQSILILLSILSMLLGAFSAIGQSNIKRLLAYSSISHMGFALMGVINGSIEGVTSLCLYLLIYLAMSLAIFISIIALKNGDEHIEDINQLSGLSKTKPINAIVISILLFSLAGIPPLAGFFAKFYVLYAAISVELYYLAVFGVLSSVISAFYYLRIIKIMYFEESV